MVIGGGDTAIDSARVSKRLGAEVTIVYRRSRSEMPAIKPEIDGALEEGVAIEFLAAPVEVLQQERRGRRACAAIRMDLGEPDASGPSAAGAAPRFRIRPGSRPPSSPPSARSRKLTGLDLAAQGGDWIQTNDAAGARHGRRVRRRRRCGVGAGHHRHRPGALCGRGDRCLDSEARPWSGPCPVRASAPEHVKLDWYKPAERHERKHVPVEERAADTEVQART